MKVIISTVLSLLTIASTSASTSGFETTKIKINGLINLYNLECVIPTGGSRPLEDRIYTKLSNIYVVGNHQSDIQIELEHKIAFMKGCDLDTLDQLKEDSHMRYGHAPAEVILTKEISKKPRLYQGKCVKSLIESLTLDFGRGIVLKTSRISALQEAKGCN